MGQTIYKRKLKTLAFVRKNAPSEMNIYQVMDIAAMAIDHYIQNGSAKECQCGRAISTRSRTGLCYTCRRNIWRRSKRAKALDAQRARKYRLNKKIKAAKGEL